MQGRTYISPIIMMTPPADAVRRNLGKSRVISAAHLAHNPPAWTPGSATKPKPICHLACGTEPRFRSEAAIWIIGESAKLQLALLQLGPLFFP